MQRLHQLEALFSEAIMSGDQSLVGAIVDCLIEMNAQVTMAETDSAAPNISIVQEDPNQDVTQPNFGSLDPPEVIFEELEKRSDDLDLNVRLSRECKSVEEALRKLELARSGA